MNHRIFVVLVLLNLAFRAPGTNTNDGRERIVSDIFHPERESLRNLVQYVTRLYFESCTTAIVYGESYAKEHPELLQQLIADLPSTYVHKCATGSATPVKFVRDSCYNYIVFVEHLTAINQTIGRQTSSRVVVVSDASSWTVFAFLRSAVARMYPNLLVISRSTSKKSKEGSFLLYTHQLYADGIGSSRAVILTSWINTELTRPGVKLFPAKIQDGFNGHQFLVSAVHKPPFSIRKDVSSSDQVRWDGVDIRTVRLIGERLNFTINVRDPKFETTSSPVNAIAGDIASARSSIGLGGVYRTPSLMKSFDTLFPHDYDCAAFASLGSTALPRYRAVLGPFQPSVWVALACVYLIAIIPLALSSDDVTLWSLIIRPKSLCDMFWFVFGTFTNCFAIKGPIFSEGLKKKAASILIGLYWVFTIITTSCYTSSIIAFITIPVYPVAMDTSKQLLSYRYRIGTLDHDGWESWFVNSDDPVTEKLLRNVELVPSVKEGVKNASRAYFWRYAFLGSKNMLEYMIQADFAPHWITKRSIMHISKECFVQFGVTAVIPRDSLFTETFSNVVQHAWQSGLIEKIKSDVRWDIQRSSSGNLLQVTSGATLHIRSATERQLTLDDMQGMFTVLGAGILIGLVTLISECIFSCCNKNPAQESDAHSDELDMRLACLHSVNIEGQATDEHNRRFMSKNARCSI